MPVHIYTLISARRDLEGLGFNEGVDGSWTKHNQGFLV